MIHVDQIDETLRQQIELGRNSALIYQNDGEGIPDYLRNMGVCPDCLMGVALSWILQNIDDMAGLPPDAQHLCTFVRAFSVGLMLGRTNPIADDTDV